MIDPDTDLLDWHWKRPVSTYGALGSGTPGDVRVALDTGQAYEVVGASATGPAGWTPTRIYVVKDQSGGIARNPEFIEFRAGTATQVTVASGGGSAIVTIGASGGAAGGPSVYASDNDGPQIGALSQLNFLGSAGVGVSVTSAGGGSAQVLVGFKQTNASGLALTDSDGPLLYPKHSLEFVGSAATGVRVVDLGGGSARVEIAASGLQGPTGPQGATGAAGYGEIAVGGSASVPLHQPVHTLLFAASGGTGVAVQNLGGGSAQVLISDPSPGRTLLANDPLADLSRFAVSNNLESDGAGAIRNTVSGLNSFASDHVDVPDVCDCMLEIEVAIGAAGGGGKRLGVFARHRSNALMAIAYLEWDGASFTATAGTFSAVATAVDLGAHPGSGVVRWLRAMFFGDHIRWAFYTADPADGFPDAAAIGRVDLEAVDATNCERVGGGCHGPVGIYLLDQGAGGSGYKIRNFKAWVGV